MSLDTTAAYLANSFYLKSIMVFHITTSAIGIIALFILEISRKSRKPLVHKSVLLLMYMHSSWTFLLCLSTLINNSITLYEHLTMRPSDIIVTASTCLIRRMPSLAAIFGSIFSQMAMAAEHYRAFNNLANYENTGQRSGNWLNAAHVAAVLIVSSVHMFFYGFDWTTAHCTLARPSLETYNMTVAAIVFACELTTIITFTRLLSKSNRLHDNSEAALSLSERYQLAQNIRMLKLFIPIIWSHTSFGMIASASFLVFKLIYDDSGIYPLVEESIIMLHLQGICIPLIFLFRHRQADCRHFFSVQISEEKKRQKEMFSLNTSKGVELAFYHDKAITEGW